MSSLVYFGPYNDPLDSTGQRHSNTPHGPDCRNPALSVSIGGGSFTIGLAVQNGGTVPSTGNIITVYGAHRTRPFATPADVDVYIARSIFGAAAPPILAPSPWLNQTIPGRVSPWRPPGGSILWTPVVPPTPRSIYVIVATLQSMTSAAATQNACVAVWVGP